MGETIEGKDTGTSDVVALDGNVGDNFDELAAVFSGEEVPGDEVTGEITNKDAADKTDKTDKTDKDKSDKDVPAADVKDKTDKTDVIPPADKDKPKDDKAVPADAGKVDVPAADKDTPAPVDADVLAKENADLRSEIRAMKKNQALMQAQLKRILGKQAAIPATEDNIEDVLDDDVLEAGKKKKKDTPPPPEDELSDIEYYQAELDSIGEKKGDAFDTLLAVMAANPETSDVEEVCTQGRFDDIFEDAANALVAKEGGDLETAKLAIAVGVWQKPNPYAFMYKIIKDRHPDFKKKDAVKDTTPPDGKVDKPADKDTPPAKVKEPAKSALSALDVSRGGGDLGAGEWTADKIDNLPEHELDKVPPKIYDLYLRGELDET